jgi:hypothetical protein
VLPGGDKTVIKKFSSIKSLIRYIPENTFGKTANLLEANRPVEPGSIDDITGFLKLDAENRATLNPEITAITMLLYHAPDEVEEERIGPDTFEITNADINEYTFTIHHRQFLFI